MKLSEEGFMLTTACKSCGPSNCKQNVQLSKLLLLVVLWVVSVASSVAAGQESWIVRHNGAGNGDDGATAIAVDTSGNAYVTGYSATSDTSSVFTTIKYDTSGKAVWVRHYSGLGNRDNGATAIAVDMAGNVYVTGYSSTSDTTSVFATIKYDTSGTEVWVARYNNMDNVATGDDGASALAVDDLGNVYVTGHSTGTNTGTDYATIKYNTLGAMQWVRRYNGPANLEDTPSRVKVDNSGNVIVTGYSFDSDTSSSFATIAYDASGNQMWVQRYGQPATFSGATAMAIDALGSIYVTGYSFDSDTSSAYTTIKYTKSGQQQWLTRYSGTGNRENAATAIVPGRGGTVHVTGYTATSDSSTAFATVTYDLSGVERWICHYSGLGNSDNAATAIAVDDSGDVYVTGYSIGSGTGSDYATIRYNALGDSIWVQRYDGPANGEDGPAAVAVDRGARAIIVTGYSTDTGTGTDYATVKYNIVGMVEPVPIRQGGK
jgi:hypothetical protein